MAKALTELGALTGASDHGVSKSLYGRDPDGNEFEVMWQVPKEAWGQFADEATIMPLDLEAELRRWGNRTRQSSRRSAPEGVELVGVLLEVLDDELLDDLVARSSRREPGAAPRRVHASAGQARAASETPASDPRTRSSSAAGSVWRSRSIASMRPRSVLTRPNGTGSFVGSAMTRSAWASQ